MFHLESFTFTQMIEVGSKLRKLGEGAKNMEEVANRVVQNLYEDFVSGPNGQKECVLVRLFKMHPYGGLDGELRQFADGMLHGAEASPAMKCLVLLATAGDRPEWNSRATSATHKAIPLPSEKTIESLPMISRLVSQLGVNANELLKPDPAFILDLAQETFNVFHVPEAEGSPYVPAQSDFVIPHRVKSILGFGGLLPPAELFAVIMFARVYIPRETAELFKTLALSAKLALIPFADRVFESSMN
jgi:hypothetical protein